MFFKMLKSQRALSNFHDKIGNTYHRKNFILAKIKTIFDWTFTIMIAVNALYMDIIKKCFNVVKR